MEIKYIFKILKVDNDRKMCEILYSPIEPGNLKEHVVGVRIPYVGQSIEQTIRTYAPLGLWIEEINSYQQIEEGVEGELSCFLPTFNESEEI